MEQGNRRGPLGLVRQELQALLTINPSDRPWQLPFAAALASGGPMAAGAAFGQLQAGTIGAVAGLSFLYLPATRLHHRIPLIMASALAMLGSYATGLLVAGSPLATILVLAAITAVGLYFCKTHKLVPPGPLFIVMAGAIAAYSPPGAGIAASLGIFAFGCLWACLVAVAYSVWLIRHREPRPLTAPTRDERRLAVGDALVTGFFVGLSLALAVMLDFAKAYWVPISCLAVLQGVSLRASWSRNVHRIVGTALGLGLTALLLPVLDNVWAVAAAITVLSFLIETAVVRHYAFAAIFITPLTIILAETGGLGQDAIGDLMTARLVDTVLGALIGLLGAVCLHSAAVRGRLQALLFKAG